MTAVYLRLAAPLQSWAGARVTGNIVRTGPIPTDSALQGLVAASLGAYRGQWPDWIKDIDFSIRIDKKGHLVDEFQTINPRDEDEYFQMRMYALMTGKQWGKSAVFTPDGQNLTSIVRRTYLSGAEFMVEVDAQDHGEEVAHALRHPRFTPYLGRKAFAPTFPYYLGVAPKGSLSELPVLDRSLRGPRTETVNRQISVAGSRREVSVEALSYSDWLTRVREQCVVS